MPKNHLSDRMIKTLPIPEKRIEYYDQHLIGNGGIKKKGVKGLLLRATPAGGKYFYYSYWYDSKSKRFKIGSYPNISLTIARDKARDLSDMVNRGIDPQAEKKSKQYEPKEITFNELAKKFTEHHIPTLKESTRIEYRRIIDNELLPKWKNLPVSKLTAQHVREILNKKAYEDKSFTMANRIRSVISKLFEFGIHRIGISIDKNPVESTAVFEQGENVRNRVYNEDEIKELWEFWETRPEPIQSVYKMLLLTGQRLNEVLSLKWSDIEVAKRCKRLKIDHEGRAIPEPFLVNVWTVSVEQQKTGKHTNMAHEIPLSDLAYEIIQNLKPLSGKSEYVFESQRKKGHPLSSLNSTDKMIKKKTTVTDFRIHDLRRTFATKTEESGIDFSVIKKVLNHKDGDVTSRHYTWYDYMDKKAEAISRWSFRLQSILEGQDKSKIVGKIG